MTTSLTEPNDAVRAGDTEHVDEVIGLREWGTTELFALPGLSRPLDATTLDVTNAWNGVELVFEHQSWRMRSRNGSSIMLHGESVREVNLAVGTEITIDHRTFVAESAGSVALRNFCSLLLGWSDATLIERALRSIRLASARRAALIVRSVHDPAAFAYKIHLHTCGIESPFVISDPRRNNTLHGNVRSRVNVTPGMQAFHMASPGGTLCVHAGRLTPDFKDVLGAFYNPRNDVRLTMCLTKPGIQDIAKVDIIGQIAIPSLKARRSEWPRIVMAYTKEATETFGAPLDCLDVQDIDWITDRGTLDSAATILDIEKAVFRSIAIKKAGSLAGAARLLGMSKVSLERWMSRMRRRK